MSELVSKWLEFRLVSESPSGKTKIWWVMSKSQGTKIGEIRWFVRWRQYCFFPDPDGVTVFSSGCLRDIAEFIGKEGK